MNEFKLQNALYIHTQEKGHEFIIPNIYLGYEESDLISVTKAGFINEYEIKVSIPDYNADFKKRKHRWMERGHGQFRNYFWFVTPVGLLCDDGNRLGKYPIPDYAGYIEVTPQGVCFEKKRPKRLHTKKINKYQKTKICRSLMFRYWQLRRGRR